MSIRFPRVERELGVGPILDEDHDQLWAALGRLVEAKVSEAVDLDFKQQWYSLDDPKAELAKDGNAELAKDCAAFANGGGGVIICGIKEDGQSRAEELVTVPRLPSHEHERILQTLASRTEPTVEVTIHDIHDPDDRNRCAVLLLIPPSSLAPHQVTYNQRRAKDRWGYPFRRLTVTEWMTEAEIANRYRNRFLLAREQVSRADHVDRVGQQALNRKAKAWVILTVVPAVPGSLPMSNETVAAVERLAARCDTEKLWLNGTSPSQPLIGRPRRGRVSLTTEVLEPLTDRLHVDTYLDGRAFAAQALGMLIRPEGDEPRIRVQQWEIEVTILNLLDMLVQLSGLTGAGGDAAVLASLLPGTTEGVHAGGAPPTGLETVGLPLHVARHGPSVSSVWRPRGARIDVEPVESTVPLTVVAANATELVSAAAHLAAELLADEGIGELEVLTTEGAVDIKLATMPGARTRAELWVENRHVKTIRFESTTPHLPR